MSLRKRLLVKPPSTGLVPSEHFGVVLYEGDGASSHSINGGKFGAGGYFNGSSSHIDFSSPIPYTNTDMTFSCWINLASSFSSSFKTIVGAGNKSVGEGIIRLLIRYDSANNYKIEPVRSYSGNSYYTDSSNYTAQTINAGSWYNVTYSYSSSGNTAKIYLNGSLVSTTNLTTTSTDSTNSGVLSLGQYRDGSTASTFWNGKIDQVRIFTKELSSSEVSTLYAETAATVESLDPLSEDTTDTLQVLGDSSCTSLYRFENNEDDKSGNYNGTGNEIQYAAGRYGQAVSVGSSTTSYVDIPTTTTPTTSSVSFWLKTSFGDAQWRVIIDGGGSQSSGTGYAIFQSGNDSYLNVYFTDGQTGYSQNILGNVDISDGQWHHVVLSMASDNTFVTYLDGASHITGTRTRWTSGDTHSVSSVRFGNMIAATANANNQFYGEIDQVRTFNKALSASEVTTLYNENSLVASYRFEGNANDDTRNYDGTASNVTYEYGLGFTPDLVWIKSRSDAYGHILNDSSRGANRFLYSNTTEAEDVRTNSDFSSFDSGGFTLGTNYIALNGSGKTFVAWCFKANGGTTSSNTDGTVTSTVQANTAAGFSIIKYVGNGVINQSIGHGLNSTPELYITKNLDTGGTGWFTKTTVIDGSLDELALNTTDAASNIGNTNLPTSSVIYQYNNTNLGANGQNYIVYAFHSVDSFSKIGSYVGNGSDNGPIVETGFEPAYIMFKRTDSIGDWRVLDNKRSQTNPRNEVLKPNTNEAEESNSPSLKVDFLSNGFQLKSTHSSGNTNGATYIYMAFAADPDTEAPTVAKSFSTVTYTGTNAAQSITGLGFKPGLVWWKNRTGTNSHALADIVRGANKYIHSDGTQAQNVSNGTSQDCISFDNDGFSVGTVQNAGSINTSGGSIVAWAWKADDNEPTIFGGPAIAVYKLDGNANDVTGNYNGTASSSSYSSGKFGNAFDCANTRYINISSLPALSSTRSVSLWVKASSVDNTDRLFGYTDGSGSYFNISFGANNNISAYTGGVSLISANNSINTGQWYHIVLVANGTTGKLYINGVEVVSTTITSYSITPAAAYIGTNEGSVGIQIPNALIDQVRIYNGAIAQEQVTELYNETASENDDLTLGAPPKSIVSANANAGFSIVNWTGSGGNAKVPHGLSSAPEMIITKRLNGVNDWWTYHKDLNGGTNPASYFIKLNSTDAEILNGSGSVFQGTSPTSTVFYVGNSLNASVSDNYIAYCFHSVSNYSKIGSYVGTGSSGLTVTTGFQADFLMIKGVDSNSDNWFTFDSVRGDGKGLHPNQNIAEFDNTNYSITFNSTSFTLNFGSNTTQLNTNGNDYIYMAIKIN